MEHKHHGKSSSKFLDADEILNEFNFNGTETFLDAGCGDGYISIRAVEEYLPNGKAYAVDAYDVSIQELEGYKQENGLNNLVAIEADLTGTIPDVEDDSVDVVLMLNVFHGFNQSQRDAVINELKRIIKDDGRIAIMEFKPLEMQWGPPADVRCSPEELEEIFRSHDLERIYLNDDIGGDIAEGRSHYLIIFKRE